MEPLFAEPRVLVVSEHSPLAQHPELTVEQVVHELFVARRAPAYWRDFWLATDVRDGHPAAVGAEVATVDECFEAILAERGAAFTQASTKRFYGRPGLAFVPVPRPTAFHPVGCLAQGRSRPAGARLCEDGPRASRRRAGTGHPAVPDRRRRPCPATAGAVPPAAPGQAPGSCR